MRCVIMLCVIMLCVIMLRVIMLIVLMVIVIMLYIMLVCVMMILSVLIRNVIKLYSYGQHRDTECHGPLKEHRQICPVVFQNDVGALSTTTPKMTKQIRFNLGSGHQSDSSGENLINSFTSVIYSRNKYRNNPALQ